MAAEHYRELAADLIERALREHNQSLRAEWQRLALSYLRLAEEAERNSHSNIPRGVSVRGMTREAS